MIFCVCLQRLLWGIANQKLFLQSLPENRKKAAQTEKDNTLRSKRYSWSPLLVQYDFWNKLSEESWQSNIASVVATLVFEAVEITCILLPLNVDCNFNFLFSFFSARLRVAEGQERDKVKELSYDYVSDEEDSTDGKSVVRKSSWRSQEADRIS